MTSFQKKPGETCRICGGESSIHTVNEPFFRHIDFQTLLTPVRLSKCQNCKVLVNDGIGTVEAQLFRKNIYAESLQTNHHIETKRQKGWKSRSAVQAGYVSGLVQTDKPSLLDVGCFDGRFLFEFSKIRKVGFLAGYDIADVKKSKEVLSAISLFSSSENVAFSRKYDAVFYSHSIFYIADISSQMVLVRQSLWPEGLLIVQIPDIEKNPFYALMGDQVHILTKTSIGNLLRTQGIEPTVQNETPFPRETIVIGRPMDGRNFDLDDNDMAFENAVARVKAYKSILSRYGKVGKYGVLGTTVNGAYVDELLGDTVEYFVDENPERCRARFRGKSVVPPASLKSADRVLVPYWRASVQIADRLRRLYSCQFIIIDE